jgi:hypothetical protein
MTARRGERLLRAVMVFPWAEAGALQQLVHGSGYRPSWIALVPPHLERPAWIPTGATQHLMAHDERAYTWRDQLEQGEAWRDAGNSAQLGTIER